MSTPKTLTPAEMAAANKSAADSASTDTTATNNAAADAKADEAIKLAERLAAEKNKVEINTNVTQFNAALANFIAVREGDKNIKVVRGQQENFGQRSIKAFAALINFVYIHQDDIQVLEAYRKAMVQHRNKALSCEEALQGMNYISSDAQRNRYGLFHILMFELTNTKRFRTNFDYEYASKVCSNPNCAAPNGFVSYVESRMR